MTERARRIEEPVTTLRVVPGKRPDAVPAIVAGAFALGAVVAATALLGFQVLGEDEVPEPIHQRVVTELAAERAGRAVEQDALRAALDEAEEGAALARRLVAALDSPNVSAADLTKLRREVERHTERVERTRVQVVKVPVPGPTVTVSPAPGSRPSSPPTAQQPPSAGPASPSPSASASSGCTLVLVGVCVVPG